MTNEERPLYEIVEKLQSAWNHGDSEGVSAFFAEDAAFIIDNGSFDGPTFIKRGHHAIWDTFCKGSINKFTVQKIMFFDSDFAIVFVLAESKVTTPGLPPVKRTTPTLIVRRRDGTWKIVGFSRTR